MAMPGGYTPQQSYGPTNQQQQPQGITFGEPAPGSAGAGSFGQQTQQPQIDQPQQQQPQQQLSREDYRDKWMSSGVRDQAGLTNFLNQYGGTQLSGNGTVKTPYGDDVIDMLIGARSGGNGMPGWTGLPGQSASSVTPWNGQQQQQGTWGPGGFGGGFQYNNGGGQQNQQWLQQLMQQFKTGGYNGAPRPQDMPYNPQMATSSGTGQMGDPSQMAYLQGQGGSKFNQQQTDAFRNSNPQQMQNPISNYFAGHEGGKFIQQPAWGGTSPGTIGTAPDPNRNYNLPPSSGGQYQSPQGQSLIDRMTQQYGGPPPNYQGPQPGEMVPNGWGGWKKYDPNSTAVS